MAAISGSDYEDIPKLAIRLIVKEILTDLEQPTLVEEVYLYGYITQPFYHNGKDYVFAIRQFHLPQIKPLPNIPEISIRQKADKYELQRQQMGYVTDLELELAKECIRTMTLEVDKTKEEATLKALRQLYGLLWLGYDTVYPICLRLPKSSKLTASISNQHRLKQLKQIRCLIIEEEDYFRLKSNVKQKSSEPARYVKDYLRAETAKKKLGNTNSSLFGKLFSYFKPGKPSKSTEEDEEDQENRTYNESECENERLFQRKTHSTRTLEKEKKKM